MNGTVLKSKHTEKYSSFTNSDLHKLGLLFSPLDGPLSVQESDLTMSHESDGSSEISTALAADVIHTGSVGDDTTLDGKAKNRNKNESNSYVKNRKVKL